MTDTSHPNDSSGSTDWPALVADRVEGIVAQAREKTDKTATTVRNAAVYGVILAILGVAALLVASVAFVRIVVIAIPGHDAWIAHLIVGALFMIGGMFAWSKRLPPAPEKR